MPCWACDRAACLVGPRKQASKPRADTSHFCRSLAATAASGGTWKPAESQHQHGGFGWLAAGHDMMCVYSLPPRSRAPSSGARHRGTTTSTAPPRRAAPHCFVGCRPIQSAAELTGSWTPGFSIRALGWLSIRQSICLSASSVNPSGWQFVNAGDWLGLRRKW